MNNKKLFIKYLIAFLTVILLWIIVVVYAQTRQEPIQKILNQIELNESELKQLELKQAELNQANDEAKAELLNKYWLEISEKKAEFVACYWCSHYDADTNSCIEWDKWSKRCEANFPTDTLDEREPWKLNESWDAQEMPELTSTTEHERFKELANDYWLNPSTIREVENHYWIKEWVILCITIAETSWWNRWAWWKNIWSVGSNDRWDRPTYALMEAWLEAIGKTLNNQYLWSKKTLWCLSNAWSCKESNDNWKRYATSESSREKNMTACLSSIYWKIDPATFRIRR